ADWFGPSDFFLGEAGLAASGTYQLATTIDLGEVYTSRISGELVAHAISLSTDFFSATDFFGTDDFFGLDTSDWEASLQLRTTNDDSTTAPIWSDWGALVIGDYTARAFQFRAALASSVYGLTPVIDLIHVSVDMPDRDVVGKDIPIPVTGLRVDFTPPFKEFKGVAIAAQGLATGDYEDWSAKDRTGFNLTIRNAAGAAVARTVDYIAKGYGRVT
ncbi:MAG: host specificity factor TipJ family phage tail protein, partial [Myxococcota bacterium]